MNVNEYVRFLNRSGMWAIRWYDVATAWKYQEEKSRIILDELEKEQILKKLFVEQWMPELDIKKRFFVNVWYYESSKTLKNGGASGLR